MIFAPNDSAIGTTAGATAVELDYDMKPQRQYILTARGAALWFKVVKAGADGAAVATAGSHYLANGAQFDVAPIAGRARISIIRDGGTDASAILSEISPVVAV